VSEQKKASGVCVLDIGHDQTFFVVMINSRINHIGTIPIGGEDFTHDLMLDLKIARDQAEEVKINYGKILSPSVSSLLVHQEAQGESTMLQLNSTKQQSGAQPSRSQSFVEDETMKQEDNTVFLDETHHQDSTVPHGSINEILTTRGELLFQELRKQLESLQYFDLIEGGIIVTGRGSRLNGLNEIGKFVMERSVQKGVISGWSGEKSLEEKSGYSTAIGILSYVQNEKVLDYRSDALKGHVFKIKRWVQDLLP